MKVTGRKGEGAHETKHRFFAKISKIDKHLQREDKHSTPGIKEGIITTDLTAQKGNKEAYEQLYNSKSSSSAEKDKFLGRHKLQKLTEEVTT